MCEHENRVTSISNSNPTLEGMHKLFLEALRYREQEIFRYLAILGPALGGFFWLLHSGAHEIITAGTIGVQLLLLLGAIYSLALGYNYRYIVLQLAKLERFLGVRDVILAGWPRCKKDFLDRYKCVWNIPWCEPPEIIKFFWCAFLIGIVFVTATAYIEKRESLVSWLVILTGAVSFLAGLILPIRFGSKLRQLCNQEPDSWDCGPVPHGGGGPEK